MSAEEIRIVDCPEIVKGERCNMSAEVTRLDYMDSTDGPVEMIGTLCMGKHVLYFPSEMLGEAA